MTNEGVIVRKFQIEFFSDASCQDPRDNGEGYMGRWDIYQTGEPTYDYAHTLEEAKNICFDNGLDFTVVPVSPDEQKQSRRWNRFYNPYSGLYEFTE